MTYSVSPHMVSLERFVVRSADGLDARFMHPKRLSSCSLADQFMAAVLRKDFETASRLMESNPHSWSTEFYELTESARFSSLVLDHLMNMGLLDKLADIPVGDHSLQQRLRQNSFEDLTAYEDAELRLEKFLRFTADLRHHYYLIKGIAFARTLYPQPHFRGSNDIDILVQPAHASALVERLLENKFTVLNLPRCVPQRGSGPFNRVQDLFVTPAPEFAPCEALTLTREGWPEIEFKFDPLDNGLTMHGTDEFWQKHISIPVGSESFLAPDIVEHTLLSMCHFHKDGFTGWKWLYDLFLLSKEIDRTGRWQELVTRCEQEGISASAWASLVVVQDRMGIQIPPTILTTLEARSRLSTLFSFTIPNRFMWNLNSLPILWLNSIYCGDGVRKRRVLSKTLHPSTEFLRTYYGGKSGPLWLLLYRILHLVVLLLPSGLTRRTLGQFVWGRDDKFTH